MATVHVDITEADEWYVGEDKQITFTVRDSVGAPVSIAGWTLEYVLRVGRSHPVKKLTKTTAAGITIDADQVGGGKGKLYIDIDRADTTNLKAGTYYHGLARTNSGLYDITVDGTAVLLRSAAS